VREEEEGERDLANKVAPGTVSRGGRDQGGYKGDGAS
jgi:hypothetical protein